MFGYFGKFFLKFRRKKTTVEILETLDKKIKECETFKQKSQTNERKFVGALVLYFVLVYILGAIVYYLYLMPNNMVDRTKSLMPFLVTPIILYFTRRFLKWFYIKRVIYFDSQLTELKREKKKIIEEVKEKETYKKAREILERFSDDDEKANIVNNAINQPKVVPVQQVQSTPFKPSNMDVNKTSANFNNNPPHVIQNAFVKPVESSVPKMYTQTPRPLLPQNRSFIDKTIDLFIGDGPNNRYALICQKCFSHNGMALKEEFEYISFRCAYCSNFNASRKKKLSVPTLKTLNESVLINQTASHETESQRPNETIAFEKQEESGSMSSSVEQLNAKPDNLKDHDAFIQKSNEFIETLPADDETSAISIKKNE